MLEFTAEDAKELIRAAWEVLSSPLAQRAYWLVFGSLFLVWSLRSAISANQHAQEKIRDAEARFARRFPGPRPRKPSAIRRRFRYFTGISKRIRREATEAFAASFSAGVIVPSILLFAMTQAYPWFDAAGAHLINAAHEPVSSLSLTETSLFVLDQSLRGGVFDLLEVFNRDVATVDNNPANLWFSAGVFVHHLMIEAFVFSGIWIYGRTVLRLRQLEQGIAAVLFAGAKNSAAATGSARPGKAVSPAIYRTPTTH